MERPRVARIRRAWDELVEARRPRPVESPVVQRPGRRLHGDAALLMDSPLFDAEWYARVTGARGTRLEMVRDYLRTARGRRVSPHPLFDPDFFTQSMGGDLKGRDPFLVYLRRQAWRVPTHPLFDTKHYLRHVDGAADHPHGPLAHYLEVGAPQGAEPNTWWTPQADAEDLRAWVWQRYGAWRERTATQPAAVTRAWLREGAALVDGVADVMPTSPGPGPLVTVVLEAGSHPDHLLTAIRGLAAQSLTSWEVVVLDSGLLEDLPTVLEEELPASPHRTVDATGLGDGAAMNAALQLAAGEWLAFLRAGDVWTPDRLRILAALAHEGGDEAVADVLRRVRRNGRSVLVGHGLPVGGTAGHSTVDLSRLLVRRETLLAVGGFDAELPAAWDFDAVARVADRQGVRALPVLGVTRHIAAATEARARPPARRPVIDHRRVPSWADVVLNRRLVDWSALAQRERDPELVSVVIPTHADWQMTSEAVTSVVEAARASQDRVQVIVVDNGCEAAAATVLDSLPLRFEEVELVHLSTNLGFALGNNLALPHVRGEVVVFLNNDTSADAGWLCPLVEALADPEVLGAQSLLLYPTGTIQSAGIAFPSTGGLPHALLQGFPAEDAEGLERLRFHALTGAALALRTAQVIEVEGFDPVFRNGMEDVDLCLRLAERHQGRFTVRPDSRITHFESRTPGRFDYFDVNRALYWQRWGHRAPHDDVDLWRTRGFTVAAHEVAHRHRKQRALGVPEPVLVRERVQIAEGRPRLRWAIKNPAPHGPDSERWGDTHFARALAAALREIGQEVVIDHLAEHERYTGRYDDVALVLRGLDAYRPAIENVTLAWVISHPDLVSPGEAASYDRLLAASVAWAERRSKEWGVAIEPMLQATDPRLFHPDLAEPDTGHPVLFVGGSRQTYRPMVKAAVEQGLPLSIYGSQWRQFVPARHIKGRYVPNSTLGAAYRAAGIVLNDHWDDMRADGFISNRLFDAAAAGARVVTDDVAGLGDMFGRSVQVVTEPEDLVRLSGTVDLDAVFGSDEERRAVAARVHREHSFTARAQRLFEIALEARRERRFPD